MYRNKTGDPQLVFAEQSAGSAVVLTNKAKLSIYKKSQNSGIPVGVLEEVYRRGYKTWNESFAGTPEQFAFDRVNSFIAGGFAVELDEDLAKACWKGYEAVGMKKKNGKKVPNCVPVKEEESDSHEKQEMKLLKRLEKKTNKLIAKDAEVHKKLKEEKTLAEVTLDKIRDYRKKAHASKKEALAKGDRETAYKRSMGLAKSSDLLYKKLRTESKDPQDSTPAEREVGTDSQVKIYAASTPGENLKGVIKRIVKEALTEGQNWQKSKYKSESGGLTKAGVEAYRRENPGSKLQTAVTTKPSKLKKGSKAWNRRKSFCARMGGMKKRLTSSETARDPDSRINKALRKWNC